VQRADVEKYHVTMTVVVVPAGIELILKSQIMPKGATNFVRPSQRIDNHKENFRKNHVAPSFLQSLRPALGNWQVNRHNQFSSNIRRWVKNYSQCRYIFCNWLYCWLGM